MKKVDIERILFYYLCGKKMEEKMTTNNDITFEEFKKIVYILIELQFFDLLFEYWATSYEQFQEKIEKADTGRFWDNIDEETKKCDEWLYEFSNNAPTEELKSILKKIFEIP